MLQSGNTEHHINGEVVWLCYELTNNTDVSNNNVFVTFMTIGNLTLAMLGCMSELKRWYREVWHHVIESSWWKGKS